MKIGIAGYTGRMGRLLVGELISANNPSLELAGVSSRAAHKEMFDVFTNPEDLFKISDCVIDFTTPESTLQNIAAAVKTKTALVIGTTGLNTDQEKILKDAAKSIPLVYAANTSVGVNILMALVEQVASKLGQDWDIEIFESHHKNKIDAPSGTALALAKSVKKGRDDQGNFITDRNGKRKEGDIGFAVSRGGDVVGEHVVTFYGAGERLELGHKASDRSLFAKGALKAAQWLNGKPAGLYTMRDVLGL